MSTTLYVDGSVGVDTNSGSSEGASPIASGTGAATANSATVALSSDSPDLSGVSVGDTIRLNGETEGYQSKDVYRITAVDDGADTVNVTPVPSTTTSSITWAIGGAVKVIQRAIDTSELNVASKLWIKASVTYTESMTLPNPWGLANTWGSIEGYTSTIGDDGIVTIDGETSRAIGVVMSLSINYGVTLRNLYCKNHTSHGFGSTSCDGINYVRCRSSNNGGTGFLGDVNITCLDCYAHDNTLNGIECLGNAHIVNCISKDNTVTGIKLDSGLVWSCLSIGNGTNGIQKSLGSGDFSCIDNTIDGSTLTTNVGILIATTANTMVINNIVTGCIVGISASISAPDKIVSENNTLFANTDNYSSFTTNTREFTSDPQFVNAAALDYTLALASESADNGHTPALLPWATMMGNRASIGALPPLPTSADALAGGSPGLHINGDLG